MSKSDLVSTSGLQLETPIQYVKGVGPLRAVQFASVGVATVADLLDYFPRDYQWLPPPQKINRLAEGQAVCLVGIAESVDYYQYRRPPVFEVVLADDTGFCRAIWFNGGYLRGQITAGQTLLVWGKVSRYRHQLQLANPKFRVLPEGTTPDLENLGGAVYPATADLPSGIIKRAVKMVLPDVPRLIEETYEPEFCKENNIIGRAEAYELIHAPPDEEAAARARRRLKFDELFLMQLGLAMRRYRMQNFAQAPAMACTPEIDKRIRRRFPFVLTADQDEVIREIVGDMSRSRPMNRLLQGDVGSGKTVVAIYASLVAVANGFQTAIMAPTEILASQHFQSIAAYLKGSRVRHALLAGGMTRKKRDELLADIESGRMGIVVGTHAVLRHDVHFARLGLVIIDEQHKFGVHQRAEVRKGSCPHCLVMTATPIPRTLAMTAFGDLDCSVIRNSPPGRGRVITRWVRPADRPKAYEFVREGLRTGKQAYFVYPRVLGTEEDSDVKAAVQEYQRLAREVFPEFRTGLVHGQMSGAEKQKTMEAFRAGRIQVLVATVVIEVGVDVPSATFMVVENADHFGLAQLHQLRGRIGRGQNRSYCLLLAEHESEEARQRLEAMTRTSDGFEIAEQDLRLRGPGELFSARQHGLPDLKIANIVDDAELLLLARRLAAELIAEDPMLARPAHQALRRILFARFGESLRLGDIA
jgi:ATP-dependent DNA helicase RecG